MAKRTFKEFEEVSEISNTSPNARIHGVLTALSPMKKSKTCSYFDGEVTDGKATMRVFGFDCGVRRRLIEFEDGKNPLVMSNCEVKRSRRGDQLEILLSKHTEVEKSAKVFDVDSACVKAGGKVIMLKQLEQLVAFQRVTVEVKALHVEEVMEVSGGKKKQDVTVGDSSGTARLTVWESEVGKVAEGDSYRLSGVVVREFRGKKFISTSKENSTIEKIEDIGDVEEEESSDEGSTSDKGCGVQLNDVCVVGVVHLDSYNGCIKCNAKVLPDEEDTDLGHCVKCKMMQCMDAATRELSVQLIVKSAGGTITLRAFGKTVQDISQKPADEVTMRVLLKAKQFNLIHRDGIIQSISRRV